MASPDSEVKTREVDEAESKGTKRPAPDSTSDEPEVNVQSANEWEKVQLGDQDRKNKFLRLMGANKKEHHGRFVIGDNKEHGSKADTSGNLVENIEAQFNQSMEHKLKSGYRGHIGLGFQKDDEQAKGDSADNKEVETKQESDENQAKDASEKQEEQDAPDSSSSSTAPAAAAAAAATASPSAEAEGGPPKASDKYKSMGFVKSSS